MGIASTVEGEPLGLGDGGEVTTGWGCGMMLVWGNVIATMTKPDLVMVWVDPKSLRVLMAGPGLNRFG